MKIIDVQWGSLYPGYELVKHLDDRLISRNAKATIVEELRTDPSLKKSQETISSPEPADLPVRKVYTPQEEADYKRRLTKAYEKFMAYLVIGGAIGIALMCTLVGLPLAALAGYIIYRQYKAYDEVRLERSPAPVIKPKGHPIHAPARISAKKLASPDPILTAQWWQKLTEANPKTQRERTHGTAGVEALVDLLEANLPDDFIVIRELLVRGGLDADVILLGPKGIWVLECKNWSGKIICKDGEWSQSKDFVKSRGKHDKKITEHPRGPDLQWMQERDNLAQTLQRRMPEYKWLTSLIYGGIVFTIPDVELSIDSTCRTEVGKPLYWLRRIQKSADVPRFTLDLQLKVLDALTSFAGRYEEGVGTRSAETLANQLYQSAVSSQRKAGSKKSVGIKVPVS